MKTKYHNPDRIRYKKLPRGRRFMTKEELNFRSDRLIIRCKKTRPILPQKDIWMWVYTKKKWVPFCFGYCSLYTYCVPIKWKGAKK